MHTMTLRPHQVDTMFHRPLHYLSREKNQSNLSLVNNFLIHSIIVQTQLHRDIRKVRSSLRVEDVSL